MPTIQRKAIQEREGSWETMDDTPVDVGSREKPLSLREEMRRFVQQEVSKVAQQAGAGSFEEEDDFSDDEPGEDLLSPYTVIEMQDPYALAPDDLEGKPFPEDQAQARKDAEGSGVDTPTPDENLTVDTPASDAVHT